MLKGGAVYEGSFFEGHMDGRGKLTFPDGVAYEGDFKEGVISGTGVRSFPQFPMFKFG